MMQLRFDVEVGGGHDGGCSICGRLPNSWCRLYESLRDPGVQSEHVLEESCLK